MLRVMLLCCILNGCVSVNIESPCETHDVKLGWGMIVLESCSVRHPDHVPMPDGAQ